MAKRPRKRFESFNCPCCGARLPVNANFCRHCGASDDCGWNEDFTSCDDEPSAGYSEDDDFDYDEFVSREFSDQVEPLSKYSVKRWATGVLYGLISIGLITLGVKWWCG